MNYDKTEELELHKRADDPAQTQFAHQRRTDDTRGPGGINWPQLLGYVFLVAAIAYTINNVRDEGIQRRAELARSARVVVIDGCKRDNTTRATLRKLILDSKSQLKQYEKEGLLNANQVARAIKDNEKAAAELPPVDCQAAADSLKTGDLNGGK